MDAEAAARLAQEKAGEAVGGLRSTGRLPCQMAFGKGMPGAAARSEAISCRPMPSKLRSNPNRSTTRCPPPRHRRGDGGDCCLGRRARSGGQGGRRADRRRSDVSIHVLFLSIECMPSTVMAKPRWACTDWRHGGGVPLQLPGAPRAMSAVHPAAMAQPKPKHDAHLPLSTPLHAFPDAAPPPGEPPPTWATASPPQPRAWRSAHRRPPQPRTRRHMRPRCAGLGGAASPQGAILHHSPVNRCAAVR